MGRLIFRNRWFALVWVAGLLASLALFFREGGGVERLDETARRLTSQQAQLAELEKGDQASLSSAPAEEEEEPAIEPSEPLPESGDIVTGQDGRRYRIVGTTPAETPASETATN